MEVKPRYRGERESWTEATVDHIKASTENALSTGPFGSSIGSQFFENRGVPVIRGSNLANDGRTCLIDDGLIFVSEAKATEFRRSAVFQGDLIFTCWGTINQVGLVSDRAAYPRYIISNKQMKLTPDPKKADSAFLFYLFSGSDLQRQIKNQSIGSSVPGFNLGRLRALRFRVPALHEQKAIAEVLSYADALVESLEQLLTKKRQIRKGAMQELLAGKRRLPGFSGVWEVKRLGDVATFHKGKGLPKSALEPFGTEPCIHYGELFTRYAETIQEIISRTNKSGDYFRSVGNDVLMPTSDVTPTGLAKASCVTIGGVILGGDILVIRASADFIFGPFLAYLIRHAQKQVLQLVTGTTVFHLYAVDMKRFTFFRPSVVEQRVIVAVLDDMNAEIAALEAKLSKARQIKQGMMQELLTGRIRLV